MIKFLTLTMIAAIVSPTTLYVTVVTYVTIVYVSVQNYLMK